MTRTSVWLAASVASRYRGDPLLDREFVVKVKGHMDGPSAGALYTVGMLVLLQGDELKPNVTMTGTILPDGSIGLVGGVAYKLEGAKEKGMKKVLLPDGLRVEWDPDIRKFVSLAEHGKKLGLEIVFVKTIEEAYREFTGEELKVAGRRKKFSGEIELSSSRGEEAFKRTSERFYETIDNLKRMKPNETKEVRRIASKVYRQTKFSQLQIDAALQQGHAIVAYELATRAWLETKAFLKWQNNGFASSLPAKASGKMWDSINHTFDKMTKFGDANGTDQMEATLLNARAAHDALDLFTWMNLSTAENEKAKNSKDPDALDFQAAMAARRTFLGYLFNETQSASKGLVGVDSAGDPELDLLAGAFSFRGDAEKKGIDRKKLQQWLWFSYNRNELLMDSLVQNFDGDPSAINPLNEGFRRANALNEFIESISKDEEEDTEEVEKTEETQEEKLETLFFRAILFTRQEVEIAINLLHDELLPYTTERDRKRFRKGGVLKSMLTTARSEAKQNILAAKDLDYELHGSTYDFLRAKGLEEGDQHDQFEALRLYLTASSVSRFVLLCTAD